MYEPIKLSSMSQLGTSLVNELVDQCTKPVQVGPRCWSVPVWNHLNTSVKVGALSSSATVDGSVVPRASVNKIDFPAAREILPIEGGAVDDASASGDVTFHRESSCFTTLATIISATKANGSSYVRRRLLGLTAIRPRSLSIVSVPLGAPSIRPLILIRVIASPPAIQYRNRRFQNGRLDTLSTGQSETSQCRKKNLDTVSSLRMCVKSVANV